MGLFGKATGLCGWRPCDFWSAQLWEVRQAVRTRVQHEKRHEAWTLSVSLNYMRAAFWSEHWRRLRRTDIYDERPDLTREVLIAEMNALADELPHTLPSK